MPDDDTAGALSRELARYPDLLAQLLTTHTPDDRGRCAGCRSAMTLAPRWPCSIASLAQAAQRLAEGEADNCPRTCD